MDDSPNDANAYRLVNDAIARSAAEYDREPEARFTIFCECGDRCKTQFEISQATYARARAAGALVVASGHEGSWRSIEGTRMYRVVVRA